jgi:rod shape determining protein RodA
MSFFATSLVDTRVLKRTGVLVAMLVITLTTLVGLVFLGTVIKGAQSWIDFGSFSIQPSDPAKLVLILVLSKYFSRRHVEIAHLKHIIVSGVYALVLSAAVFFQSDFGSAIIIFCIWFGMVLVSGISKKHLIAVLGLIAVSATGLWLYGFEDYQRQRILSFISPLADIQGTGYNAYQATVAIGSGEIIGKGIGYGTQSRLQFLPEYETDFIFAAFAEEWGYIGVLILLGLLAVVIWRVLSAAARGAGNFETFYAIGLSIMLMTHIIIHVGMNMGLMPVTGTPLPFVSYGGSHLVTEFVGLGLLMAMGRYGRSATSLNFERA